MIMTNLRLLDCGGNVYEADHPRILEQFAELETKLAAAEAECASLRASVVWIGSMVANGDLDVTRDHGNWKLWKEACEIIDAGTTDEEFIACVKEESK